MSVFEYKKNLYTRVKKVKKMYLKNCIAPKKFYTHFKRRYLRLAFSWFLRITLIVTFLFWQPFRNMTVIPTVGLNFL